MSKDLCPKSEEEFIELVQSELNGDHDYNTSAEAVSNITVAAFNYAGSTIGITGFQAGWAGLNALRQIKNIEGPFAVIEGTKFLFPQYDLHKQLDEWHEEWKPALSELAKKKLNEKDNIAHPKVKERWEYYAHLDAPAEE